MPIYEYQCQSCGHEFETIQKVTDAPLRDCPACGRPELNKLVSAAGFRLKGGGWYETDFKRSGDTKRNLAGDHGEAKKSEGGASSKEGAKTDQGTKKAADTPKASTA